MCTIGRRVANLPLKQDGIGWRNTDNLTGHTLSNKQKQSLPLNIATERKKFGHATDVYIGPLVKAHYFSDSFVIIIILYNYYNTFFGPLKNLCRSGRVV